MIKLFKSLLGNDKDTDKHHEKEKKNFEVLKYDGMRAQRIGRLDYAIQCYTNALEIEEDFETLHLLSQSYLQVGNTSNARKTLERMAALEPTLTNTHLTLANVYYMEEEYLLMTASAKQVLELEKEHPVALYLLAKANRKLNDPINAIVHLTRAIAGKEDFIEALLMRSEVLLSMQQTKEAEEDAETVLKLHPEEESALLLKGSILEANGRPEEAERYFKAVTELNPFNEQAYIKRGQLHIHQKKLTEAIALLDEAIELNPNSASAYHERGRAKLLNGDKEGSTEDMKRALQLNPKGDKEISGEFKN